MTLSEIRNNITELVYQFKTDDYDLSDRQVDAWINYYRARLVKEYYEKKNRLDNFYIQDAGCIELECVNANDCCGLDIKIPMKRSVKKIPQILDLPFGNAITFVGLIDKLTPVPLMDHNAVYYTQFARYTKNKRKVFILDNYLYLVSNPADNIHYLNLRGLFENPEDLKTFKQCDADTNCFDDNTEYPIPSYMIQLLTELILKTELRIFIGAYNFNDDTNSAKQETNSSLNRAK